MGQAVAPDPALVSGAYWLVPILSLNHCSFQIPLTLSDYLGRLWRLPWWCGSKPLVLKGWALGNHTTLFSDSSWSCVLGTGIRKPADTRRHPSRPLGFHTHATFPGWSGSDSRASMLTFWSLGTGRPKCPGCNETLAVAPGKSVHTLWRSELLTLQSSEWQGWKAWNSSLWLDHWEWW